MNKIIVIGCPGSGKSTFSKELNKIINIPLYHLDNLFWNADKTTKEKSVFLKSLHDILEKDKWIIDGNFNSTLEQRLQACDTVIFLDYPIDTCLKGIEERRGIPRSDIPWIETEEDQEFIEFVKNFNEQIRPQMMILLKQYSSKNIYTFNNREEANDYLRKLGESMLEIKNKIDLHLHIDGSVKPNTVYELSRKYQIEPECHMTLEEIMKSMMIQEGEYDPDFLTFDPALRIMQTSEGIKRVTKELIERLESEKLIYAELRFAPQYHLQNGLTQEEVVQAAITGLNEGLSTCKRLKAGLILCTMNHKDPMQNHDENMETVRLAHQYLNQGVVGLDLAGYEENMLGYRDIFELAHQLNIPTTTHSEFTVKDALEYKTTRIGHGYQAALIEELTQAVIDKKVTLEMCPDSSLSYEYGLNKDETHPIVVLFKKGARVTVNTDNLTVLDTSLEKEYEICREMGLSNEDIIRMNNYAIEASFASDEIKQELLKVQPL